MYCFFMMYLLIEKKAMVVSKEEFQRFSNVGNAFIVLQTKMKAILNSANFGDLRRACIVQMHNPGGAQLSPELIDKIKITKNVDELLDQLVDSPYWSWIDVRIMEAMVIASDISQAQELFYNYKAVVFSKRLLDLLPNVPSKKVKQQYYDKIIAKIKKDSNEMTVADLLEFQSQLEAVIMDIKNGVCILENLDKGCVEVHWYIPTNCVDIAYQNARRNRYQFSKLFLQNLKIGLYPVINDPLDVKITSPSEYIVVYIRITFTVMYIPYGGFCLRDPNLCKLCEIPRARTF